MSVLGARPPSFGAAVCGGIGGALFWVALRATAGVACLLAVVLLLSTPTQTGGRSRAQADLRQVARRLRPLLVVVAVTATVEFGGFLLLLLHLQRGFGLTVGQIALVFLPGSVILTALPLRLYAVVRRIGRAATLTSSLVASAIVVVGLAFAALGHSWLAAVASGRFTLLEAVNGDLGDAPWQLGASRIWLIIFLVDSIWTWARLLRHRRSGA